MTHDVKILPQYFSAAARHLKCFEVRRDDRGYAVGDYVNLREYDPDRGYSGDFLLVQITYILRAAPGLSAGYCIWGWSIVTPPEQIPHRTGTIWSTVKEDI